MCLNRADQAKNVNALKEIAGIYSLSKKKKKCKPLRPSEILISEKLVAEVIRVLEGKKSILTHLAFLWLKIACLT